MKKQENVFTKKKGDEGPMTKEAIGGNQPQRNLLEGLGKKEITRSNYSP